VYTHAQASVHTRDAVAPPEVRALAAPHAPGVTQALVPGKLEY
jgi:hypothetical protein